MRCITSHKTGGNVLALSGAMPYNAGMVTETAESTLARLYAACPAAFPGSDLSLRVTFEIQRKLYLRL
ncbi:MAG: hypothetical protein EBV23_11590 [Flavobacteriia bacterium]|nr:hypothetical protein [Flavobacteriia bacterium]